MNVTDGQAFLQIPRVRQIRLTLRIVWAAMIVSMGWVSFVLHHSLTEAPLKQPLLAPIAVVIAVLSFVLPDWISRALRPPPSGDAMDAKLGMLLINHILRFALTEAALMLVLLSHAQDVIVVGCAYGIALGLMFFHFPTDQRIATAGG
jgi:hypothetical protein